MHSTAIHLLIIMKRNQEIICCQSFFFEWQFEFWTPLADSISTINMNKIIQIWIIILCRLTLYSSNCILWPGIISNFVFLQNKLGIQMIPSSCTNNLQISFMLHVIHQQFLVLVIVTLVVLNLQSINTYTHQFISIGHRSQFLWKHLSQLGV